MGRSGEETLPSEVEGLNSEFIVNVACGDSISCALTREGRVYAWGTFRNSTGIYGFSSKVEVQDTPKLIEDLKDICSIAAGSNHVVAISTAGKIYTWGVGEQNQLGRKIIGRNPLESALTPRAINFKPKNMVSKVLIELSIVSESILWIVSYFSCS